MKRWLAAVTAAISLIVVPFPAHAASERIVSFDTAVHVSKQNIADITETIQYDFGSTPKHGIYRTIPVQYSADKGKKYYLKLVVKDTLVDGAVTQHQESTKATDESIRLGDPNKTITGVHTYKLHYQLSPIVTQTEGKDFLTLDAIGTGWEVPIEKATASIELDDGLKFRDLKCFSGSQGSTQQKCQQLGTSPAKFAVGPLGTHEGMTITGTIPGTYVDHYLMASVFPPLTPAIIAWLVVGAAVALLALFGIFIWIMRSLRARRRRKNQTVIAEYEPPDNLTPAEMGLLEDDKSDLREITATLIDLAVRGYLRIEQTSPKKLLSKAKYKITQLKDYKDTNEYEQRLLNALFGSSSPNQSVSLDAVDTTKMASAVQSIKQTLKERLSNRALYGRSKAERGLWHKMIESGTISDAGAAEWARVAGFKDYLSVVEKDRLKFTDAPEKTPERFSKLLPYAIALGVEQQWAKQFEGIDITQNNNWYYSQYGAWTALSLADDLNTGFAAAVQSNFVQASSTSGGSSGGGFGGGGGGSW